AQSTAITSQRNHEPASVFMRVLKVVSLNTFNRFVTPARDHKRFLAYMSQMHLPFLKKEIRPSSLILSTFPKREAEMAAVVRPPSMLSGKRSGRSGCWRMAPNASRFDR